MRIDFGILDPTSPLAKRIRAAMSRDATAKAEKLAANGDLQSGPESGNQNRSAAGVAFPGHEREADLHAAVVTLLRRSAAPGTFWTHFPAGEKRTEATGRKLAAMGTKSGVPDFVVVVAGRALFLELKTATGKLSAMQKHTHAALMRAGAEIAVVRCVESAAHQLRRWQAIA